MGLFTDLLSGLFSSKSDRKADRDVKGWASDRVDPLERERHIEWLRERSKDP